jgi:hypothetical protein
MDTILKSFQIGFILRCLFSGVFFVLAYCVSSEGYKNEISITAQNLLSFGLPLAAISGVIVYGIHRSVVFPFIEWLLDTDKAYRWRANGVMFISENTIRNLRNRWRNRGLPGESDAYKYTRQLEVWGDYIHNQYAACLCIIFGSSTAVAFSGDWRRPPNIPLVFLVIFFLGSALFSHWRAYSVEQYLPIVSEKRHQV